METKEFTNDFSQGMTNIPSDSVCQDDSVAAEWNMIFRNGEHQPIQAPRDLGIFKTDSFYILHVHKASKVKHYIGVSNNHNLVYCTEGKDTVTISEYSDYNEQTQVTSIGNTLIVNVTGKELRYFLWKPDSMTYKFIGNKLPKPKMEFALSNYIYQKDENSSLYIPLLVVKSNAEFPDGISYGSQNDNDFLIVDPAKKNNADTLLIGLYSQNKKKAAAKKLFCLPFFVKYALKLFDGSYANISNHILLYASVKCNSEYIYLPAESHLQLVTLGHELIFRNLIDFSDWQDIIKSVTVFATEGAEIYDTDYGFDDKKIDFNGETEKISFIISNCLNSNGQITSEPRQKYKEMSNYNNLNFIKKLDQTDILRNIKELSVFYKIFEVNNMYLDWTSSKDFISSKTLENLVTQEQLDHDDYFSNCPLTAESIYMYNKRLHLSNVSRGFFNGGTSFLPLHTIEYTIVDRVQIKTAEGVRVVLNKYYTRENPSIYFYYPDPRAFHVDRCVEQPNGNLAIIYVGGTKCSFDLKTHPFLNGAYYMRNTLPSETDNLEWSSPSDIARSEVTDKSFNKESVEPENLSNEVWVSEVNNPFVFNAQGVNTVGNGIIIGVISNTRAISQGQFGQFPLFCFTTDGIWMLSTSTEGIYSASSPISREVCNNKYSITATDNLVFFTSEKGLMMINGADVTCVSSQLSGNAYYPIPQEVEYTQGKIDLSIPFLNFIRDCRIAYDYRDNLLWITNNKYNQCFILSIESGAFSMRGLPSNPVNIVNDYPDNIILCNNDNAYSCLSLINRPNINDDERRIDGFIFSRPMKFGTFVGLKSLSELRLMERLNEKAGYRLRVFVSDDLNNWTRTNSLRGRGFKYYKLNLIFENMLPTDSVSAIIGRVQTRYQTKFR